MISKLGLRVKALRQRFELRDPHFAVGENRPDLQRPAQRLDVFGESAQVQVRSMFDLGHFALIPSKGFREPGLRHLPGTPQFIQRHRGDGLADMLGHLVSACGWHVLQQFIEFPGWHYSFPSFLSSSRCSSQSRSATGTKRSYHRSSPVLSPPISKKRCAKGRARKAFSTAFPRSECAVPASLGGSTL